jgi:hypothetical protein
MQERLLKPSLSPWTKDDLESSIKALDKYADKVGQTALSKLECKPINGSTPPLLISGVRVKVTPDVTVHRGGANDEIHGVGAVVAMIAKGEGSGKARAEAARYAATLVWLFAQQHLKALGAPDRSLCFSYDVFDGSLVPAGSNYVNRIKNIQAACEEIADRWYSATPPDDLDAKAA